METADVMRWFPTTRYYQNHAQRIAQSLAWLRPPPGFSCLSIGTWGAEVPYLVNVMGAKRVVCVRGPDVNVLPRETRVIHAPNGLGDSQAEILALNLERDRLPPDIGQFDVVLMWEIIEHLCLDPAFMVSQAIEAAKIGGVVSLTTPNALWHVYTTAQLFGANALGLKLQHHKPFATHWRLYSPAEIAELLTQMGCEATQITSFLDDAPFSLKSRAMLLALRLMRRKAGHGDCSYGKIVYVCATKVRDASIYRPAWLYPRTGDVGGQNHLREQVTVSGIS